MNCFFTLNSIAQHVRDSVMLNLTKLRCVIFSSFFLYKSNVFVDITRFYARGRLFFYSNEALGYDPNYTFNLIREIKCKKNSLLRKKMGHRVMMSIMINNPSSIVMQRRKKKQITASWFYHLIIVVYTVSHDYFKNKNI